MLLFLEKSIKVWSKSISIVVTMLKNKQWRLCHVCLPLLNFWCCRSPSAHKIRRENGDDGTFSINIQIPKDCGEPVCAALWLGLSEPLVKR